MTGEEGGDCADKFARADEPCDAIAVAAHDPLVTGAGSALVSTPYSTSFTTLPNSL